jgi:ribosome-binding protein aMBF1 (putative translation factor)
MATQTTVTMTCDLCGGTKDTQTRTISLDGVILEIDLCAKDGRGLDKVAQKFIPYARKVRRLAGGARRTASTRQHSASVRDWAKAQGLVVSDRGRIPADVERRYAAAH